MKELCSSDVYYSESDWDYDYLSRFSWYVHSPESMCEFLNELIIQGNSDPNVLYYYNTYCKSDQELTKITGDSGAYNMDTVDRRRAFQEKWKQSKHRHDLMERLIKKYKDEYEAFYRSRLTEKWAKKEEANTK